jgi:hypothetical protein
MNRRTGARRVRRELNFPTRHDAREVSLSTSQPTRPLLRFRSVTQWSQARVERLRGCGCNDYMARSTKVRISAKLLAYRKLAMAIVRRRQNKGSPTLSDVLSGEVTKQVMKADQVTREEVEDLMAETRRTRDKS